MADQDPLVVIDTDNVLTRDDVRELKKLAAMSRYAKFLVALIFGTLALIGVPTIFEYLNKN